ncbi:hypothetical protein [Krasilnikoviella flava]|uniref:Uncharacterized protein n=1 Tax=Krasilnikoviella flava TaxID=526729 RepID=A0A1T5L5I9_9MICO|nr:hypothetical protein [Krasilnikoviella flava]SKC70869.1 hypothetical protein SAMN04324258_2834 [Krasilnikoviella flava]
MSARRFAIALSAAGVVVAAVLLPAPAHAVEIGAGPTTSSPVCALERVGHHFVRCDDLTGDGRPAPAHVAQWTPGSLR